MFYKNENKFWNIFKFKKRIVLLNIPISIFYIYFEFDFDERATTILILTNEFLYYD